MENSYRSAPGAGAILLAVVCALSPALAADLPTTKSPVAPPVVAPAPFTWNGFYLGAFGGGSFANDNQGYSVTSPPLAALPPIIPVVNAAGSRTLSSLGADLGLDAGYNWSVSRQFVLGVEGDVNWSGLSGNHVTNATVPLYLIPFSVTQKIDMDWRSSLRLRAGVTPIDNLLVYATGGPAVAHFAYSNAFWDAANETENRTFKAYRAGWTIGSGLEWAFNPQWSLNGEYRYSQFSAVTATGSVTLTTGSIAYIAHSSGPIQENSFRIGVGYHFN